MLKSIDKGNLNQFNDPNITNDQIKMSEPKKQIFIRKNRQHDKLENQKKDSVCQTRSINSESKCKDALKQVCNSCYKSFWTTSEAATNHIKEVILSQFSKKKLYCDFCCEISYRDSIKIESLLHTWFYYLYI